MKILLVPDKPALWKYQPTFKFAYMHGAVNLTCGADGNPKPEFIWYRHGKKIFTNIHHENSYSFLEVSFSQIFKFF